MGVLAFVDLVLQEVYLHAEAGIIVFCGKQLGWRKSNFLRVQLCDDMLLL